MIVEPQCALGGVTGPPLFFFLIFFFLNFFLKGNARHKESHRVEAFVLRVAAAAAGRSGHTLRLSKLSARRLTITGIIIIIILLLLLLLKN